MLIYGASGSVGTFAVQLANYFETSVTGVCSSTNIEMVKALGAGQVIDYTQQDFTNSDETYDLIFDAVGKLSSARCKKSLNKGGVYLNVLIQGLSDLKLKPEHLLFLKELMEEGKLRAVIDITYALDQIVDAHQYVDKEHKKGNVLVLINHNE